uniref:Granulin b n=1 Tax=Takifugu rubripes TaxID=31033 RepID=H2T2B2_TAKRU
GSEYVHLCLLFAALVCPDGGTCEDRNTCCRNSAGGYSCCPLPHAECCSDHLHCCYQGTLCDLEHHKCVNKTVSLPWLSRLPAAPRVQAGLTGVICPDSKTMCPDGATCCQLPSGSMGCCLFSNAVCCEDKLHCCPEGTRCDLSVSPEASIICPDGKSRCQLGHTCCQLASGAYGCCPLQQAVCCSDHERCCPAGTRCDLEHDACVSGATPVPMLRIAAVPGEGTRVFAATAAETRTTDANVLMPARDSTGATPVVPIKIDNNKCDESTTCPGDSTCCRTLEGGWACCPLAQAVCCDDHVHCCPHDTICNLETQTCDGQSGGRPPLRWVEKVPASTSAVQCDEQTSCPGGSTCCKMASGQWACCPLPEAVCCSDGEHCCPKGYRCNLAFQTCDVAGGDTRPWLRKVPARQEEPSGAASGPARPAGVMCDDRTSCPRDTSCCFMQETRRWGCCPVPNVGALTSALPQAVCCEDGDHCCPRGHRCDPHRRSCSKGPLVTPWFTKLSAAARPGAVTDVPCDDRSSCPAGTTCCKLKSGGWGCCPLVKAVCCNDHEHCCPQGYSCNTETGTCEKKDHGAPVFAVPQRRVLESRSRGAQGVLSCGGTGEFHCPKEDTCCPTSATEWACCPSPRAVCCSDQKHCCPAGFSCDPSGGCVQDLSSWDAWFDRSARGGL